MASWVHPNSKHRDRIVPSAPLSMEQAQLPSQPPQPADPQDEPPTPPSPKARSARSSHRLDWDTLVRRTFGINLLHCDRCGGRRGLIALITQDQTANKSLAHLGHPT